MENRRCVRMWPLLYFHADWPAESYKFDLFGFEVFVFKANQKILEVVGDVTNEAWANNNNAMCNFYRNTEWFLSLPVLKPSEHAPHKQIGLSVENELEGAIVNSFLMSLRLIHQTAAICPLTIEAEIVEESIDPDSIKFDDYFGIDTDAPPVFEPEEFQIGDIQRLSDVWSSIIRLRNLNYWIDRVYTELFFVSLDKKASEDAEDQLRELLLSLLSPEDTKIFKGKISSTIKQLKSEEGKEGIWQELWAECFRKAFKLEEEETFSNRTRIGRALNLFYEGLLLPRLHAFLSMNLVLETLFTIGEGETTYKLATRLAQILGRSQCMEERKGLHDKARTVYRARSKIVHGEKLVETINTETIKDAFTLVRRSLQCILLNDELLGLYSNPGTTDRELPKKKGPSKKKARDALEEYFLKLSLMLED